MTFQLKAGRGSGHGARRSGNHLPLCGGGVPAATAQVAVMTR